MTDEPFQHTHIHSTYTHTLYIPHTQPHTTRTSTHITYTHTHTYSTYTTPPDTYIYTHPQYKLTPYITNTHSVSDI